MCLCVEKSVPRYAFVNPQRTFLFFFFSSSSPSSIITVFPVLPLRVLLEHLTIFKHVPDFLSVSLERLPAFVVRSTPLALKTISSTPSMAYDLALKTAKSPLWALSYPAISRQATLPSSTHQSPTIPIPICPIFTYPHIHVINDQAPLLRQPRYSYRLMPDWRTSYLRYNLDNLNAADAGFHVDEYDIQDRYPALDRYIAARRDILEPVSQEVLYLMRPSSDQSYGVIRTIRQTTILRVRCKHLIGPNDQAKVNLTKQTHPNFTPSFLSWLMAKWS